MKRRRSKGQSLVESTFVLLGFLSLLLGMTAIGQKLFIKQELTQRVHDAARWGALNPKDPEAIRNLVRYGTSQPPASADAFDDLKAADVRVSNPGCPGAGCRISVAVPTHGVQAVEPVEAAD